MKYLTNAFSLKMLKGDVDFTLIRVRPIESRDVPKDVTNCIRHKGMERVIHGILGFTTKANLADLVLEKDDILYVAQYKGSILYKDATCLPEGAQISFMEVSFKPNGCGGCEENNCSECETMNWLRGGEKI